MSLVQPTMSPHGTTLGGQTLVQYDDDSCYAAYELRNLGVGMTYETNAQHPYLRLTPAIKIPENARKGVRELLFTHPDERFADLSIDESDGEIIMQRILRDPARAEAELADCLAFLDDVAWPALIAHVSNLLETGEQEEKGRSITDRLGSLIG